MKKNTIMIMQCLSDSNKWFYLTVLIIRKQPISTNTFFQLNLT